LIKAKDGQFYPDVENCDGENSSIAKYRSCWIPTNTMRNQPFSLDWGSEVIAKIVATNAYGDSPESDEGGGAILIGVPDAP
jgi:hypothetical protein